MAIQYRESDARERPGVYQRSVNRDGDLQSTRGVDETEGIFLLIEEWSYGLEDEKDRWLLDEEADNSA